MNPEVWVAGEVLIDIVPAGDSPTPVVGGGPANTSKALARLGIPTSFIGGISKDEFGYLIREDLKQINLGKAHASDLPTAVAIVSIDKAGSATYEFKLQQTATFDFRIDWLPKETPEILYIGSLACVIEPGASELFEWACRLDALIVFDPNIRPNVISDRIRYCQSVERWVGIASVVKLSEEDFEHLGYSDPSQLLNLGCDLVVLTRGAAGISAFTRSNTFFVPGVSVEVIDTVGAGDTVGAVLVEALINQGFFGLISGNLELVLKRAAIAAAICCARAGAKPPTAAEIETFLN